MDAAELIDPRPNDDAPLAFWHDRLVLSVHHDGAGAMSTSRNHDCPPRSRRSFSVCRQSLPERSPRTQSMAPAQLSQRLPKPAELNLAGIGVLLVSGSGVEQFRAGPYKVNRRRRHRNASGQDRLVG